MCRDSCQGHGAFSPFWSHGWPIQSSTSWDKKIFPSYQGYSRKYTGCRTSSSCKPPQADQTGHLGCACNRTSNVHRWVRRNAGQVCTQLCQGPLFNQISCETLEGVSQQTHIIVVMITTSASENDPMGDNMFIAREEESCVVRVPVSSWTFRITPRQHPPSKSPTQSDWSGTISAVETAFSFAQAPDKQSG